VARIDKKQAQERLDRIAELLAGMVAHAEEQSRHRCPYRNRFDHCTAGFRCRHQRASGDDAVACTHEGSFDYRSAWESAPRTQRLAKKRIDTIKRAAAARRAATATEGAMTASEGTEFIVIGENIHTTRVVLKRGKRFVAEDGREGVRYIPADGEERVLPIPEAVRRTQDYEEGRIKHVAIALRAAMSGDADQKAEGLAYLGHLVRAQERAGANFLDVNVDEISIKLDEQKAAIDWLVRAVRDMGEVPVAVDSSDLEVIRAGLEACGSGETRPLLNSASLERPGALDLALAYEARVVVTAAGESSMPTGVEERLDNASRMVDAALAKGIALSDIFIDPLIFPISVDTAFGLHSLDAMRGLRGRFGPEVHITGGLSNVSFGIPARRIVNDVFLILAVDAGADSGIIDPVVSPPDEAFTIDRGSQTFRLAEDLLLGRDEHCRNYIRAWRKKQLEPLRAAAGQGY
jgi:5-methyltetrahydrofolate--homocysteine methyltransferase